MADEDESSKTEEPSERKLSKAKEEGHVPMSQEVKSWFMLFAALLLLWGIMPWMLKYVIRLGIKYIEIPHQMPVDPLGLRDLFRDTSIDILVALIAPLGLFFLIAIVSAVIQVGFMYAPKKLNLKWERINLFQNMTDFINKQKIMEMLKGIMKICMVGYGGYAVIKPKIINVLNAPTCDVKTIIDLLYALILWILITMVLILFVIAFGDYFYQKFSFLKKQRMTKQEVKDEYKQSEGDPQIKMRVRQIRMERVRKNMMKKVPDATVVVTNPTHFAVAIKYDPDVLEYAVPRCVAKGQDFIAQRIKEIAKEHDVPMVENVPLARALYKVAEIDQPIPNEYFKEVAEVIRFVYDERGMEVPTKKETE
ncbi:MAG: flagellar biosynthesis protein FlhB [Alphaproteobacteria bacterium]|nr:flagellar biosynthesis protein FlhB [Alphaproteobacteria bacterium]